MEAGRTGGSRLARRGARQEAGVEQEEQILDVAFPAAGMLVLSPSKVTFYTPRENGAWAPQRAVPLAPGKPWPRDLRGRLRVTGASFSGISAGHGVRGAVEPALSMECRAVTSPGCWNRAATPRCWPISPLRAITSTGASPPRPVCEEQ